MKVQIEMNDLREALYGMHKVTSSAGGVLPVRGMVYIKATDSIELWVKGEKNFIRAEMKGEVIEEGAVCLHEGQIYKSVKKLNKHGGDITIDVEDNYWASCSTPKLDFRLVGNHPDDFPALPEVEGDWKVLDGFTVDDLDFAAGTASEDDNRKYLCGVHFTNRNDGLAVVSTDGHRLTKIELDTDEMEFPGDNTGFTIDREAAEVAAYILGRKKTEDETISFAFADVDTTSRHMGLKFGRYEVYGEEAEDGSNFPDFVQVLPTHPTMDAHRCHVDREEIREKIDATSLFASPKTNNIRLMLDEDEGSLEFYASDPDKGEGRAKMEGLDVKQTCKAGYNYKYLLQAIDAFETDQIAFIMVDSLSPTVVHKPGKPERLMVVMPMRL